MSFNSVKKKDYLLLNNEFPCSVIEVNKSKPGKHGSAKYAIRGRNLLTGRVHEMLCNSHDMPKYLDVRRYELFGGYVDDGYVYAYSEIGEEESHKITDSNMLEKIDSYDGDEYEVTVAKNHKIHNIIKNIQFIILQIYLKR